MPEWTHAVCDMCFDLYAEENGWSDPPVRVKNSDEWCCFCRDATDSGIFVRFDPNKLRCGDLHTDEAREQLLGWNGVHHA